MDLWEWERCAGPCAVRHLCDAVVLQVDDSGHGHLHAAEHRHHLQLLIVKRRSAEVLNKADESQQETVTFIFSFHALFFLFHFHKYSSAAS